MFLMDVHICLSIEVAHHYAGSIMDVAMCLMIADGILFSSVQVYCFVECSHDCLQCVLREVGWVEAEVESSRWCSSFSIVAAFVFNWLHLGWEGFRCR